MIYMYVGMVLFDINATDCDSGLNGNITYTVTGSEFWDTLKYNLVYAHIKVYMHFSLYTLKCTLFYIAISYRKSGWES